MKKNLRISLMAGILVMLTGAICVSPVKAATVASMNSNSNITFSQNSGITPPVNPTIPSENVSANPNDPGGSHSPGTAGPLSIDYISNFYFGTQTIKTTPGAAVYYANQDQVVNSSSQLITVPNYVQVTDQRGLNLGWGLSVKQNGQFTAGSNTLSNATLGMIAATPASTMPVTPPVPIIVALDPTGTNSSKVAAALLSAGMGTWAMAFGTGLLASTGVSLTIPAATAIVSGQQYTTTLTWTLNDAPI